MITVPQEKGKITDSIFGDSLIRLKSPSNGHTPSANRCNRCVMCDGRGVASEVEALPLRVPRISVGSRGSFRDHVA